MTLSEQARAVCSRDGFLEFLFAFIVDFEDNGGAWENAEISSFLAAMVAWGEDMDGFYINNNEDASQLSPWRIVADMLMAARSYE